MKSLFFIFLLVVGCGLAVGLTREYVFISNYYNWHEAVSYCKHNYRDLATITSAEENERVFQSKGGYCCTWIGLTMLYSGTWTWSDGDPAIFRNWIYGPYFSKQRDELCAFIYYTGTWSNQVCWNYYPFVCYRFLILVKEKKTWEEALEVCRTNYTGLATVTSEMSLRQLNLESVGTETESVWTGLRFMNGQWFWVNGEPLGSLVSMPSCPAQSYRCGALNTTTNTLQNLNCNEKLNFVCYWK
ncbi:macrophage mannose receptor 1-like [Tachysurus fulvidraco]|uniref:macrophage mannose receptor 1-like n=1 Tax=Tachysurus fulvidraco TaxID=1234273 RepID=UPI001FEF18B4|nr:macrophage mannose receptor 1-like [Tachysurus fulvidraco]